MPRSHRWTHFTRTYPARCVTARIQRQMNRLRANFSLKKYKTWPRAECAALKWLRTTVPALPAAISSKNRMTRRNTSGVVGVHPHYHTIRRRRKTYEYFNWVSRWFSCKLAGGVRWSTNKFGEDEAWVLAVKCRRMENENREDVISAVSRMSPKGLLCIPQASQMTSRTTASIDILEGKVRTYDMGGKNSTLDVAKAIADYASS